MTNKVQTTAFEFSSVAFNASESTNAVISGVVSGFASLRNSESSGLCTIARTLAESAIKSNGAESGCAFVIQAVLRSKDWAVKAYRGKIRKILKFAGFEFDEKDSTKPVKFSYPANCRSLDDVMTHATQKYLADIIKNDEKNADKENEKIPNMNINTKLGRKEAYAFIHALAKKAYGKKYNNKRIGDLIEFVALNIVEVKNLKADMGKAAKKTPDELC